MATRMTITKTTFVEPEPISFEIYIKIKNVILSNPDIDISPQSESFSEHFSLELRTIRTCVILILIAGFISFVLGIDNTIMNIIDGAIGFISIWILFITGIQLLSDGPSYATFLKNKKDYFDRMKYAIQNTYSYDEFFNSFYKRKK